MIHQQAANKHQEELYRNSDSQINDFEKETQIIRKNNQAKIETEQQISQLADLIKTKASQFIYQNKR